MTYNIHGVISNAYKEKRMRLVDIDEVRSFSEDFFYNDENLLYLCLCF